MKDETRIWLNYADENFESARILLTSDLYNPCLQNIQQRIEKALKALIIEHGILFRRSHSIGELKQILSNSNHVIDISDDECDLLDSIYLPSKYPIASVLPDYHPDKDICLKCIS